jgi:uncharacterized membrane protein YkvA (DUF1232 family)
MPKDYMEVIHAVVQGYSGEKQDVIMLAPHVFSLLANLHEDNRITKEHKRILNAAMAYFVHPYDIFPEDVYGAYGYIDDIFMAAYLLRQISSEIDKAIIQDHWMGDGDVMSIIENILSREKELVGENLPQMLDFVGLDH